MRLLRSFLAVAACLALSARTHAQTARVDSLPVALVNALLQPGGGGDTREYYVGKVPPQLERFLFVPGNARVLGGMSSYGTITAVLELPNRTDEVTAMYQREMPKLGWAPPAPPARQWGFVPANGMNSSGNGLEFCHIGQSIQIMPATNGAGGTRVTATVQNYGNQCEATRMASGLSNPPKMPTLTNPTGTLMNVPGCLPQGYYPNASTGTSEYVQTTQSPQKLIEFFARQLADSGWGSAQNLPSARENWIRPEGADTREVTLSANVIPRSNCVEVVMQLRTLVGPPPKPQK